MTLNPPAPLGKQRGSLTQNEKGGEGVRERHSLIIGLKDKHLAEEIEEQVSYFGYHCEFYDALAPLLKTVQEADNTDQYGVILLDTKFCPEQDPALLKPIAEKIPIFFISDKNDVSTRIFAVQAGGLAYFVTPIEFTSLIEKIDQVIVPQDESPPYKVLIIEDSQTQASTIKKHLNATGILAKTLICPMEINNCLNEFQPDLILLDLYMPNCSGIDIAKMIRQQDLFMSIPIVFLSAEEDKNKQLFAMKRGGDDFLTKNISATHLIEVVSARAERSRRLRSEMILDSLTGLLNHTRIIDQLEIEIARARRNNSPLCFAMIDLDHFKNINDEHGHPVGDRVIKALARMLKQRLRRIDSVGRYGGEEFAVVFPQSSEREIYKVLDEIRVGFSKLLHRSANAQQEFSSTFSVGIAQMSNDLQTVDKLVHAADIALYEAKRTGRNRIIIYHDNES